MSLKSNLKNLIFPVWYKDHDSHGNYMEYKTKYGAHAMGNTFRWSINLLCITSRTFENVCYSKSNGLLSYTDANDSLLLIKIYIYLYILYILIIYYIYVNVGTNNHASRFYKCHLSVYYSKKGCAGHKISYSRISLKVLPTFILPCLSTYHHFSPKLFFSIPHYFWVNFRSANWLHNYYAKNLYVDHHCLC